jgi:hypothetical protein
MGTAMPPPLSDQSVPTVMGMPIPSKPKPKVVDVPIPLPEPWPEVAGMPTPQIQKPPMPKPMVTSELMAPIDDLAHRDHGDVGQAELESPSASPSQPGGSPPYAQLVLGLHILGAARGTCVKDNVKPSVIPRSLGSLFVGLVSQIISAVLP